MQTADRRRLEQQVEATGQGRDLLEERMLAAVYASMHEGGLDTDVPDPPSVSEALVRSAVMMAASQAMGSLRQSTESGAWPIHSAEAGDRWVRDAERETLEHLTQLVASRKGKAIARQKLAPGLVPGDGPWARSVARTEATRLHAEAKLSLAEELFPQAGMQKVWISRGDSRVRELHRKLHGESVPSLSHAFWRWPGSGELRYPGDPTAPLGEVINCRCVLFFLPTSADRDLAAEALKPSDLSNESFALAASATQGVLMLSPEAVADLAHDYERARR